jgi:6-phosphogluconolactonase
VTSTAIRVHPSPDVLANATAARLVTRLVDAQASRGTASVVLTGGRIGIQVLRAVRDNPARDAVDWRKLDVWWGDERFVPADDPERNDRQAREALLDHVPLDPARVHPMPSSDSGLAPEEAAGRYAEELAAAARQENHGPTPQFDVLMLGVGPEGHVASLFPEMPGVYEERPVTAVRGCPKPPPTRISLTFPTLNRARELWLIAAGEEKAPAVALALTGAGRTQVPAAGVGGSAATLWLLDRAAAAKLPAELRLTW